MTQDHFGLEPVLTHGDFHVSNCYWSDAGCGMFDFQLMTVNGGAGFDLASMFAWCPLELLKENYMQWIEFYIDVIEKKCGFKQDKQTVIDDLSQMTMRRSMYFMFSPDVISEDSDEAMKDRIRTMYKTSIFLMRALNAREVHDHICGKQLEKCAGADDTALEVAVGGENLD